MILKTHLARSLGALAALVGSLALLPARADDAPTTFDGQALFVGDYGAARILRVASDRTITEYAVVPSPCQMLFDDDGTLFVAGGKGIWKIAPHPADKLATVENGLVTAVTDKLTRAKALARDRDGNFWVSEFYADTPDGKPLPKNSNGIPQYPPGTLKKVSADGKTITAIEPSIVYPYGLAAAPDGSMLLGYLGDQSLVRYLPDGSKQVITKMHWPRNPFIAPDGSILIMGGREIVRFPPGGGKELVHDMTKDEFGATHSIGLAVDNNGFLYSTDWIKRAGQKNEGLLFRYENGKRTVFARVGISPSWIAFWPPTSAKPAAKP